MPCLVGTLMMNSIVLLDNGIHDTRLWHDDKCAFALACMVVELVMLV